MAFKKNDPNINRKGRPRLNDALSAMFRNKAQIINVEGGKTLLETTIESLWKASAMGDLDSAKTCFDRGWGRVTEELRMYGEDQEWDLSGLTEKELEIFGVILAKVRKLNDSDEDQVGQSNTPG